MSRIEYKPFKFLHEETLALLVRQAIMFRLEGNYVAMWEVLMSIYDSLPPKCRERIEEKIEKARKAMYDESPPPELQKILQNDPTRYWDVNSSFQRYLNEKRRRICNTTFRILIDEMYHAGLLLYTRFVQEGYFEGEK